MNTAINVQKIFLITIHHFVILSFFHNSISYFAEHEKHLSQNINVRHSIACFGNNMDKIKKLRSPSEPHGPIEWH